MKNADMPAMPLTGDAYQDFASYDGTKNTGYNPECQGLTKREQACITLGIPESGDPELDELIFKSERKRISAQILSGFMANNDSCIALWQEDAAVTVKCALANTDALLEGLSK